MNCEHCGLPKVAGYCVDLACQKKRAPKERRVEAKATRRTRRRRSGMKGVVGY